MPSSMTLQYIETRTSKYQVWMLSAFQRRPAAVLVHSTNSTLILGLSHYHPKEVVTDVIQKPLVALHY